MEGEQDIGENDNNPEELEVRLVLIYGMGHTSKKVMEMCSRLLWEATFTFYASWIGKKIIFLFAGVFFQNGVSVEIRLCARNTKASVKYPNQTYADMLHIAFLSQTDRQCHVVLKQC